MRTKNYEKGICFFLLLISTVVFSQKRTSDFGLVGKVQSVQSKTTSFNSPQKTTTSGFLDSEDFDSFLLEFDARRNLILRENYLDYKGKLGVFDRTVLHYNHRNQIEKLETTLIQNGEEPKKTAQKKIFYYLKNQLIRVDEFNFGRTSNQYWVVNSVFDRGKLKEKVFWMDDEIFSRTHYQFDWNNNPISEKTYHNNGVLGKTLEYQNNSSGLPVKITNQSGNMKVIEEFDYGENYIKKHNLIDSKGQLLESKLYDDNGMISEAKRWNHTNGNHDVFNFRFKFDQQNNWTECEINQNNVPMYRIIRTIKYYK